MRKGVVSAKDMEGQAIKFSAPNFNKRLNHNESIKFTGTSQQYAQSAYVPVSAHYAFSVPAYGITPSYYHTPYGNMRASYCTPLPHIYTSGMYYGMHLLSSYSTTHIPGPHTSPSAVKIPSYSAPHMLPTPPGFNHTVPSVSSPHSSANICPVFKSAVHPQNLSNISLNVSSPSSVSKLNFNPQDSTSSDFAIGVLKSPEPSQEGRKVLSKAVESEIVTKYFDGGQMLIRGSIAGYNSDGTEGILETNSKLNITIQRDVVYVNGMKVNPETILRDILPLGTSLKAVLKEVQSDSLNDKTNHKYTTVVAWFGDTPSLKEFVPSFTRFFKKQDLECSREYFHGLKTCSITNDECSDDEANLINSQERTFSHIIGYVWWADENRGILRIYENKGWGSKFSGILFTQSNLHFDGQQVNCRVLHQLLAHVNKCEAQACKIETKVVFGMEVKWEAVHVECGRLPPSLEKIFIDTVGSNTNNMPNNEPLTDDSGVSNNDDSEEEYLEFDNIKQHVCKVKKRVHECTREKAAEYILGANELFSNKYTRKEKKANERMVCMQEGKDCNYREDEVAMKDSIKSSRKCLSSLLNDLKVSYSSRKLKGKEYAGKHLTGCIVELFSCEGGSGLAKWPSMEFGNIFIKFKQEEMYFQLVPLNKMLHIPSSVYTKRCNLYVLPIENEEYNGYKVKLVATCGWIGNKPAGIPSPGTQTDAYISITHLNLDNEKATGDSFQSYSETNGKTILNQKHLSIHSSDININRKDFKNAVAAENNLSELYNSITSPKVIKSGSPIDQKFKQGKLNTKTYLAHESSVSLCSTSSGNSSPSMNTTLSREASPSERPCSKIASFIKDVSSSSGVTSSDECWMIGMSDKHELLTGEVVEVHSNMGKLRAKNGTQYYFSRDHCYLYGISLQQVELWHVLVNGQRVQFRLAKTTTNRVKVAEVVIGLHYVEGSWTVASYIKEWCKNNAVPDSARDMLMKQLEGLKE